MEKTQHSDNAHVLIIPAPAQGHITPALKFAELLALAAPDFHITFVNTEHIHRLLRHAATSTRFARYPRFRFKTFTDGLPDDYPRPTAGMYGGREMFGSFLLTGAPQLRRLLGSSANRIEEGDMNAPPQPPVTCVVADGLMEFPIDVCKEFGVPLISFNTVPACCFWAQLCVPKMIESGELPTNEGDMDNLIKSMPGVEGILRVRDLPSFFQVKDSEDPGLQFLGKVASRALQTHALIFNTFEDLEAPVLSEIRSQFPTVYTLGPLHAHLVAKLAKDTKTSSVSNSLREADKSCIAWLDLQASNSVIYVSFGSTTTMTRDELMEIYHGLMNSQCKFLWVIRSDSIEAVDDGNGSVPEEVASGMTENGRIVSWAPQEEVLTHPAVGGFFTHSGWNSTLECIGAGKPMICWPFFGDQPMNSRFVSEVWRLGLDIKGNINREIVERFVRDLMVERRDDFARSAVEMAESVTRCVDIGGSSHRALNDFVCDIRLISVKAQELKIKN